MYKILFSILFFLLISNTNYAQKGIDDKEMVGFGCSISGVSSKPVYKVSELIDSSKYDQVIKLLESKNSAEK